MYLFFNSMFFSPLVLLLAVPSLYFLLRCFGHVLRVGQVRPLSAQDLFYASKLCTITIKKFSIKFHRPRRHAPYWAIITGDGYEYKDGACHVSIDQLHLKLWVFPVHFRFTAGPWVESTLDGFRVRVLSSKDAPWWINCLRQNLVDTIINGDTILLHSIKTKAFLGTITGAEEGYRGKVARPGLDTGEGNDALRVRCEASHWNVLSTWRMRMYSFGTLTAEMRRSWVEGRGSFVLIAEECRWTKLASPHVQVSTSALWVLFSAICCFPVSVLKLYTDPMSLIDIYSSRADITFSDFRLRDAELLRQGAAKLTQQCSSFEHENPGVLGDVAWNCFVAAALSCFQE